MMMYKDSLFDDLFNSLFYNFPQEVKPPYSQKIQTNKDGVATGVVLQLAVAGFKMEDIKVWYEDRELHIEGDNRERDGVLDKFKTSFSWKVPVSDKITLEKSEINFEDGLLTINIPIEEPAKSRKYLFGRRG
jgi:HSP20 family molecular chaperone IbpA